MHLDKPWMQRESGRMTLRHVEVIDEYTPFTTLEVASLAIMLQLIKTTAYVNRKWFCCKEENSLAETTSGHSDRQRGSHVILHIYTEFIRGRDTSIDICSLSVCLQRNEFPVREALFNPLQTVILYSEWRVDKWIKGDIAANWILLH